LLSMMATISAPTEGRGFGGPPGDQHGSIAPSKEEAVMARTRITGVPATLALVCLAVLVAGCASFEFAPNRGILFSPREFPAADRVVEAARSAGKAAQCPAAFAEAEGLRDEAYKVYLSCRTAEGIALANQATAKANALCPVVAQPAPP